MAGDLNSLIYLLLYLVIGGLIVYVAMWILGQLTLPQPIKMVITVLVAIIVILFLVRRFGLL